MTVSVLMSVYKEKSQYIREAIDSILNQTYKDFEFVIVGDTPDSDRDKVFSLIEEYCQKDKRIVFIPNETNIGLTKSLNVGLSHCKGKYIARMDADDISLPTRLEKQIAFMEENPDVLASGAWIEIIDEEGKSTSKFIKHIADRKENRFRILFNSILGHPIAIFHRIINNEPVRYDESVIYAQDYYLWVWILQYGDITNLEDVLLKYRVSNKQISSAHLSKQRECARLAQRRAFTQLYDFPHDDSFFELLAHYSIDFCDTILEEKAKSCFCDFLGKTKISKVNYEVINYLIDFYIRYFSHVIPKRRYQFIYDITKKNAKLFVLSELKYAVDKISGKK